MGPAPGKQPAATRPAGAHPTSGDGGLDTLPDAFWAVARRLRHSSREGLAGWKLSPSQARAMRVLMHHNSLRLSQLAEHLDIAARSATEVVDDLEQLGYVRRSPDPDDRRATLVSVSPRGQEIWHAVRAARAGETDRLFSRLSADDQENLLRILRILAD